MKNLVVNHYPKVSTVKFAAFDNNKISKKHAHQVIGGNSGCPQNQNEDDIIIEEFIDW